MTGPGSVTFTGPCDSCGADNAVWTGKVDASGGAGTVYTSVDCLVCGKPWTVAAQAARRESLPESHPVSQPNPTRPVSVSGLYLFRLLQRAFDRRAA